MNAAIIFARGAEKGKRNINLYLIDGKPLIYYSIKAGLDCSKIQTVFVSTDDEEIAKIAKGLSQRCEIIKRGTSHYEVGMGNAIIDAIKQISEHTEFENFVILSGNTAMISSHLVEKALLVLETKKTSKSVLSVWKSRHDHPDFALIKKNGNVSPFFENPFPQDVYFYDGSVCAIRKEVVTHPCFKYRNWWARLPDCVFLVRPWPTGRDVHDSYGLSLARWWIETALIDISEEV